MKTVVFLGSKKIGLECFKLLLKFSNDLGYEIIGVGTSPRGRDIRELAESCRLFTFENPDAIPACDILISVQYHKILSMAEISKARQLAVNLHMAPLPEYRGCNQFSFAILNGDTQFGTTLHIIDEGVDSGDILFEERFPIPGDIWVEELYEIVFSKSLELFNKSLPKLITGQYKPCSQKLLKAERGCSIHYRHEIDMIKQINLSWSEDRIERHIRATYMPGFEPPYTLISEKKVYFSLEGSK